VGDTAQTVGGIIQYELQGVFICIHNTGNRGLNTGNRDYNIGNRGTQYRQSGGAIQYGLQGTFIYTIQTTNGYNADQRVSHLIHTQY